HADRPHAPARARGGGQPRDAVHLREVPQGHRLPGPTGPLRACGLARAARGPAGGGDPGHPAGSFPDRHPVGAEATMNTDIPAPSPLPIDSHPAARSDLALGADLITANAPAPVFVPALEGKILQANEAVSQLLGFRRDEVVEQSLSRFISPEETREFTAALREVVAKGVTRNARLNPRSAAGEV